jgi:hypothetical protein
MESSNDVVGIFQSDLIIRTALVAALADMRANPWLLDYVFASLKKDALTQAAYGKEVRNAKNWFLHNDVKIVMNTQLNAGAKFPCISIELGSSGEVPEEATLGDVHYTPREDVIGPRPNLCDAFTPTSWDPASATLVLPLGTAQQLDLAEGLVVVTAAGAEYRVDAVLNARTAVLGCPVGTNVDFRAAVIRGAAPSMVQHVESSSFAESFSIGIHVHGRPVLLVYLHSIVVFCLLRYKEVLLEQRGFERSTFSSSEAARNAFFGKENVFSRYINLSGRVRQYWPKFIGPKITSVAAVLGIADGPDTDIVLNPLDTSAYGLRGDTDPGAPDNGPADGAVGPAVSPQQQGGSSLVSATAGLPPGVNPEDFAADDEDED